MPRDYQPFERIAYRKPEITSIAEAVWIWFSWTSQPIQPGQSIAVLVYTIPTGYKAVVSDINLSSSYRAETVYYFLNGDNIFWSYHDAFEPVGHTFELPPVGEAGQELRFEHQNLDIVPGYYRFVLTMWLVPGSQPEEPKEDDPEERFRVGDFSSVQQIILPNNETLYLLRKRNEEKVNYLRFKDYGLKSQKVISKFHLKIEEAEEIMRTLREKPEKVKEILERLEKRKK